MESLWLDRRKKKTVCVRISWLEEEIISDIKRIFGESSSAAILRALWTVRILYDPGLRVGDALRALDPNMPLHKALKPLPELAHILGLEYHLWKKKSGSAYAEEEGTDVQA